MRILRSTTGRLRPALLCVALAVAATPTWAQPAQDVGGPARELMCNRPAADCAGSGLARQLDLVAQPDQPGQAQVQPASAAQAGQTTVRLTAVRFTGASAVSPERLQQLAAPYLERDVGLAQLEALAQEVTDLYRQQGYFLAQALVPVQKVTDGQVEISVVEGRLGRVLLNLAEDLPVSEAQLRAFLQGLETGAPLQASRYERVMLLLSDLPGIRVSSGLQAGLVAGTTDLVLDVTTDQRVLLALDADNHGVRDTGRLRGGGTLRVASPLGIGDNLDLRLMISEDNGLNYGRIAWEAPLGASGLRVGVGAGRSRYELDGVFAQLGMRGTAEIMDVSVSYPLIRQRGQNLFLRAGAEVKLLHDEMRTLDYTARKRVRGVSLGWAWERRDGFGGGGYWASSGTLYHGRLELNDALSAALDRPPAGRDTRGSFTKLGWQLSRLQTVTPRHLLYVSVGGQFASKNLDAIEKFSLGGPRAVRAYASGEVLVDQGVLATVEWRWAATNDLTPFLFFDAGRGRMARHPAAGEDSTWRSLRGAGVGVVWAKPRDFSLTASLAWRSGTPRGTTDGGRGDPRLYVQLQKVF